MIESFKKVFGWILAGLAFIGGAFIWILLGKNRTLQGQLDRSEAEKSTAVIRDALEKAGESADGKEKTFNDMDAEFVAAMRDYNKSTGKLPE